MQGAPSKSEKIDDFWGFSAFFLFTVSIQSEHPSGDQKLNFRTFRLHVASYARKTEQQRHSRFFLFDWLNSSPVGKSSLFWDLKLIHQLHNNILYQAKLLRLPIAAIAGTRTLPDTVPVGPFAACFRQKF